MNQDGKQDSANEKKKSFEANKSNDEGGKEKSVSKFSKGTLAQKQKQNNPFAPPGSKIFEKIMVKDEDKKKISYSTKKNEKNQEKDLPKNEEPKLQINCKYADPEAKKKFFFEVKMDGVNFSRIIITKKDDINPVDNEHSNIKKYQSQETQQENLNSENNDDNDNNDHNDNDNNKFQTKKFHINKQYETRKPE